MTITMTRCYRWGLGCHHRSHCCRGHSGRVVVVIMVVVAIVAQSSLMLSQSSRQSLRSLQPCCPVRCGPRCCGCHGHVVAVVVAMLSRPCGHGHRSRHCGHHCCGHRSHRCRGRCCRGRCCGCCCCRCCGRCRGLVVAVVVAVAHVACYESYLVALKG